MTVPLLANYFLWRIVIRGRQVTVLVILRASVRPNRKRPPCLISDVHCQLAIHTQFAKSDPHSLRVSLNRITRLQWEEKEKKSPSHV